MKVLIMIVLALCIVLSTPMTSFSSEWVWQADNYKGGVSLFTDGKTEFKMEALQGWDWYWGDPALGTVSLRGFGEKGRGFGFSSDFGEALDIDKGVTIAARIKPINTASGGTLCLSIANSSTADLPGGSTCVWVGWDVPDVVAFTTRCGTTIRSFLSSVEYEGTWCIWTLSAKQIGDTVAWDVWINGVRQGADQKASDGTLHTAVLTDSSDMATTVNIGQREWTTYLHDTAWDYVAISNEGVIPGWNGNTTPSAIGDSPPRNRPLASVVRGARLRARLLVGHARVSDALEVCDDALGRCQDIDLSTFSELKGAITDLSIYKAIALHELNRLPEAVQTCDEALERLQAADPLTTDSVAIRHLKFYKAEALLKQGKMAEGLQVCDDALGKYKPSGEEEMDPIMVSRLKLLKAQTLLQEDGRESEVLQLCEEALSGCEVPEWMLEGIEEIKAWALQKQGRVEEAIGVLEALEAKSDSAEGRTSIRFQIARMYWSAEKRAKAISTLLDIINAKDTPPEWEAEVRCHLGAYYWHEGRTDLARDQYLLVVSRYPESSWSSEASEALADMEAGVTLTPEPPSSSR